MYKITVVNRFINDYLRSPDCEPLEFDSVNGALKYLSERNCTIEDCLQFDFHIEEAR